MEANFSHSVLSWKKSCSQKAKETLSEVEEPMEITTEGEDFLLFWDPQWIVPEKTILFGL